MRSDLTTALASAKNAAQRKPRQLLVFKFATGWRYISDQEINLGGVTYEPLVESWGSLEEAADPYGADISETRQLSLTLWNGGATPFSNLFLQEDPEDVEVLLYQWFEGLLNADKLLLDRFVVQDPIAFDESSRLLTLDLVSINMRYDGDCGLFVTKELWPYAKEEHVGNGIPLVFGNAGRVGTSCIRTAPRATLKGSIAQGSKTILCNESLGERLFPAAGFLQIGDERIQYSSRSDTTFTVQVRGYANTAPESHPDNAEVHQLITNHQYIVGHSPIAQISSVWVDGYPAPDGIYSVDTTGAFGKITFNQKPYSWQFATSAQTMEALSLEVREASNTAWQAYYAIDANKTSSSAMINAVYPTLSLKMANNPITDQGLIVTAYLEVHHWETNVYNYDYADVWVEGIGVVGRLTRPSADDVAKLQAQVDVVDPVTYKDPGLANVDPQHPHMTGATNVMYVNGSPASVGPYGRGGAVPGDFYSNWQTFYFHGLLDSSAATKFEVDVVTQITGNAWVYYIEFDLGNGNVVKYDRFPGAGPNGRYSMAGNPWYKSEGTVWTGAIRYRVYGYMSTGGGSIAVYLSRPFLEYNHSLKKVEKAKTDAYAYLNSSGQVNTLLTKNKDIEILSHKSPSRTLIDRFDISDFLTPSWGWFTNRRVEIRYIDAGSDSVNIFIPWLTFIIEFRKRERVYSDEVTAVVTGDTASRPNQVLQRLLVERAKLPAVFIDTAGFAAAGAQWAALGYSVDGIIEANTSVREACRKVCRQTRGRLFWSGGLAKLAVRKAQKDWSIVKSLGPANYQLKSISVTRQRVQDLINYVELFYRIDRTAAKDTWAGQVTVHDQQSIDQHGQRSDRERFRFDLVRTHAMAADLAAYYVSVSAYPSSFYEFNAYLDQLELEKEDVIEVTSGFNKMRKVPMVLRAVNRIFGSGKNKSINHLRIIAENLRYLLLSRKLADTVTVMDDLIAVIGEYLAMADSVHAADELLGDIGVSFTDVAVLADALEVMWNILEEKTETVAIADELRSAFGLLLTDTVSAADFLQPWEGVGFGTGGFGRIAFGGLREFESANPDEVLLVDQVAVAVGSAVNETVEIDDHLMASNGYGSAGLLRTEGFGRTPFGH